LNLLCYLLPLELRANRHLKAVGDNPKSAQVVMIRAQFANLIQCSTLARREHSRFGAAGHGSFRRNENGLTGKFISLEQP